MAYCQVQGDDSDDAGLVPMPKARNSPPPLLPHQHGEQRSPVASRHALRIYDITLAVDNFGAGFSSSKRLRQLPFSELKPHAGFVAGCGEDAGNAGIRRAAFDRAYRFDVVAVADGREKSVRLAGPQRRGCDAGQGPLLAEPMPISQFITALRERTQTNLARFT